MAHITDFLRIRGSSYSHTGHLDVGIVGWSVEALLCASSILQLDIVTVKVFGFGHEEDVAKSFLELDVDSLNAIHAISPQLFRALTSVGEPFPPSTNTSSVAIRGSPLPHTPAARGIQAGVRVQQAALTDLISAALPRDMLQPDMHFVGAREEVNGVQLNFQTGEPMQAKLLVMCGDAASTVSATVGQNQPWGRGRIAVIPKAADGQVNVEAAVELAYSLSEHGLTPAAFRAFAMSMARSQDAEQDGLQQRAFPPVAQPEALKGSATSSMGSSPCGSLKMQELRPFEASRGLQNSAA